MEITELLSVIANGEDSRHQFKETVRRAETIAGEFIAFNNSDGGWLIIGVTDDGKIGGLSNEDVSTINLHISNAATDHVRPPITVTTENIALPDGMVIVIEVPKGLRPRTDKQGVIWVKNGADKRKVTAIEEMQRMFQSASLVHADELPVQGATINDIDRDYFAHFFERVMGESLEAQELPITKLLENMNLMKNGQLNTCGTLLLAQRPQFKLPIFIVKAVTFAGNDIADQSYIDSQDIVGKLTDVFQQGVNFILRNIHHQQANQGFNSVGQPEIPRIVFEELLANALIHRDYFISAPVKLLIFIDRIEIISPGHLPNNLTVDNIKSGNSNTRNPVLSSFASQAFQYRGLGSGILRALKNWPHIDFIDDRQINQFKVVIKRYPE